MNAAIPLAAASYPTRVHIVDLSFLTPGGRFRRSITIAGVKTPIRMPDGIHLNDAGAEIAAGAVIRYLETYARTL